MEVDKTQLMDEFFRRVVERVNGDERLRKLAESYSGRRAFLVVKGFDKQWTFAIEDGRFALYDGWGPYSPGDFDVGFIVGEDAIIAIAMGIADVDDVFWRGDVEWVGGVDAFKHAMIIKELLKKFRDVWGDVFAGGGV